MLGRSVGYSVRRDNDLGSGGGEGRGSGKKKDNCFGAWLWMVSGIVVRLEGPSRLEGGTYIQLEPAGQG